MLLLALGAAGWFGIWGRSKTTNSRVNSHPTFTNLSPREIIGKVNTVQPFDRAETAESYVGTTVDWKLSLFANDRLITETTKMLVTFSDGDGPSLVTVVVPTDGNDYIRSAAKGETFRVQGVIQYINPDASSIRLANALLENLSHPSTAKKIAAPAN